MHIQGFAQQCTKSGSVQSVKLGMVIGNQLVTPTVVDELRDRFEIA